MKKSILLPILLLATMVAGAQSVRHSTANNNAWFMYIGDHKFADKWGVHLEAQFRRRINVVDPQQLLLRTGINYHLNANAFVTAGYCFVETYPYGGLPVKVKFPEHRFWEQLQIKSNLNRFEWISRFRLEQRFSQLPVLNTGSAMYEPGDAVYTNRFRLMNRFSLPLKGTSIQDNTFYLTAYDEIFINAGKKAGVNVFDQNRLYGAIGYKIPKVGRLEAGYLEQTIIKSDGVRMENNHTLQLGLSSNIDFYKKRKK